MTGLVYLIRANDTDHYKIGFTTKTPEERRAALQTGNHRKLEVITSWHGTADDERKLHALLGPYRREGEWFELTVANLITLICQYEAQVRFQEGILSDAELEARVVADIQDYYFEFGPYNTDGGQVVVSQGYRELLRMRVIGCHLWKWYPLEDILTALPFEHGEQYQGQDMFDICLEEGWVEAQGEQYRIDPNLNQAGYEFLVDAANLPET